jgi:hypothetical protein
VVLLNVENENGVRTARIHGKFCSDKFPARSSPADQVNNIFFVKAKSLDSALNVNSIRTVTDDHIFVKAGVKQIKNLFKVDTDIGTSDSKFNGVRRVLHTSK